MAPTGVQSLKLLLVFAAATGSAVLMAVGLHHGGVPQAVVDAQRQGGSTASFSLPVLNDEPPITSAMERSPRLPRETEQVVRAIPVAMPVDDSPAPKLSIIEAVSSTVQSPPAPTGAPAESAAAPVPVTITVPTLSALAMTEAKPLEVAALAVPHDPYQPFKDSVADVLRKEVPKAIPIPMVYQAVVMNDNEWLRQLLKSGFAVNDTTPFGDTALCAAIKARNQDAVEQLLLHGADPTQPGRDGQPPLALASLIRTERAVPALLKAGADANTTFVRPVDESLLKPLPYPELCESLRDDRGVTVLMAASARGDTESVIALLQHGAKAEQPTKRFYRYAINYAAEQGYLYIMRILLGRPPESEPETLVTVDISQQKAFLAQLGQEVDKTSVSTGREGFDTPEGRYLITDKHASWTSTIYHVEMPYFMRLNCSAIGLHAGYVTGEPASHGCVRLPYEKAKKWFGMLKVGDEVQIVR